MAQGRRKKSKVNVRGTSSGLGGRPGTFSVDEVKPMNTMAGASPAELRGGVRKRRRKSNLTGKVAGFDNPDPRAETRGEKQRKSDLKRIREIKRRQRAQAQADKSKQGKTGRGLAGRSEGVYKMMGSDFDPVALMKSELAGSGNLRPITPGPGAPNYLAGARRTKKAMGGAVMKKRGGTFKGVF